MSHDITPHAGDVLFTRSKGFDALLSGFLQTRLIDPDAKGADHYFSHVAIV